MPKKKTKKRGIDKSKIEEKKEDVREIENDTEDKEDDISLGNDWNEKEEQRDEGF